MEGKLSPKAATPEGPLFPGENPTQQELVEANSEESAKVPRGFGSATSHVRFSAGAGYRVGNVYTKLCARLFSVRRIGAVFEGKTF